MGSRTLLNDPGGWRRWWRAPGGASERSRGPASVADSPGALGRAERGPAVTAHPSRVLSRIFLDGAQRSRRPQLWRLLGTPCSSLHLAVAASLRALVPSS